MFFEIIKLISIVIIITLLNRYTKVNTFDPEYIREFVTSPIAGISAIGSFVLSPIASYVVEGVTTVLDLLTISNDYIHDKNKKIRINILIVLLYSAIVFMSLFSLWNNIQSRPIRIEVYMILLGVGLMIAIAAFASRYYSVWKWKLKTGDLNITNLDNVTLWLAILRVIIKVIKLLIVGFHFWSGDKYESLDLRITSVKSFIGMMYAILTALNSFALTRSIIEQTKNAAKKAAKTATEIATQKFD